MKKSPYSALVAEVGTGGACRAIWHVVTRLLHGPSGGACRAIGHVVTRLLHGPPPRHEELGLSKRMCRGKCREPGKANKFLTQIRERWGTYSSIAPLFRVSCPSPKERIIGWRLQHTVA